MATPGSREDIPRVPPPFYNCLASEHQPQVSLYAAWTLCARFLGGGSAGGPRQCFVGVSGFCFYSSSARGIDFNRPSSWLLQVSHVVCSESLLTNHLWGHK